jgi:hypothetical protein
MSDQEYYFEYLRSIAVRFERMYLADVDTEGLGAFEKMLVHTCEHGKMSPSHFKYLFDRTHPRGSIPGYNKFQGYHRKYGSMLECPVEFIALNKVDWSLPKDWKFIKQLKKDFGIEVPLVVHELPIDFKNPLFKMG